MNVILLTFNLICDRKVGDIHKNNNDDERERAKISFSFWSKEH